MENFKDCVFDMLDSQVISTNPILSEVHHRCIFIDIEVNSLEHREVIELSYCVGFNPIINELFKPVNPIDIETMSVHNIVPKMVEDKELFINSKLLRDLNEYNKSGFVFVAHNAEFDVSILNRYLTSAGYPCIKQFICTLNLPKYLHEKKSPEDIPGKFKLGYLRYYYDVDRFLNNVEIISHRAESDVIVLRGILVTMIYRFDIPLENMIKVTEYCLKPENFEIFFGKYKGKKMKEVYATDPRYLDWAVKNFDDKEIIQRILNFFETLQGK